MRSAFVLVIVIATALLVGFGLVQAASTAKVLHSDDTPEQAVNSLLDEIRAHNLPRAYAMLANKEQVEPSAFNYDMAGGDGSLRTYSALQDADVAVLHKTPDEASVRVKMNWSTAIGTVSEIRDLKVLHRGKQWQVAWPTTGAPKLPAQIMPVNYLRWDIVNRGPEGDWGASGIDSPKVRIISMNAVERPDRVVIMGEVVNEDTIPAYINVNATLISPTGSDFAEESSFDKVSHVLLPSQVTPYRIDFLDTRLSQVKQVRMDIKAGAMPATADPVIGVMNQRLDSDALGAKILRGELENQSGQVVNIAHVLATCYDNNGKVIWVSDGYVQRALLPGTPEPFAVDLPEDISSRAHSFRVMVSHYNRGSV